MNDLVPVKIEAPRDQSVFGRGVRSIRISTWLYAGDLLTNQNGRRRVKHPDSDGLQQRRCYSDPSGYHHKPMMRWMHSHRIPTHAGTSQMPKTQHLNRRVWETHHRCRVVRWGAGEEKRRRQKRRTGEGKKRGTGNHCQSRMLPVSRGLSSCRMELQTEWFQRAWR